MRKKSKNRFATSSFQSLVTRVFNSGVPKLVCTLESPGAPEKTVKVQATTRPKNLAQWGCAQASVSIRLLA